MTDQLNLFGGETVAVAAERVRRKLDEGSECPCCHRLAKRYKRSITAAMAHVLGLIAKHERDGGTENGWTHVPSFLSSKHLGAEQRGGDFAKLVHWGLLEERVGERTDGSNRVGWYRLTLKGGAFVKGEVRVPKYIYLYNQVPQDVPVTETLSFVEALGKGFDYWTLMYGRPKQEGSTL